MDTEEKRRYQVKYSATADYHFYEVAEFFSQQHTLEKAAQMVDELEQLAQSLAYLPDRGSLEKWLKDRLYDYRFLLYKRTNRADVKIIYFVDEKSKIVYVTDFFPTEKDVNELIARNA